MIHLTDSILLIEVPEDAKDFKNLVDIAIHWESESKGKGQYFLPKGFYTILGTIRNGKPDFDVEPYVESITVRTEVPARVEGYLDLQCYKNYMKEPQYENAFINPIHSFTSLLQSKEVDMSKHYLVIEKK